jgi:hypothetical protein
MAERRPLRSSQSGGMAMPSNFISIKALAIINKTVKWALLGIVDI